MSKIIKFKSTAEIIDKKYQDETIMIDGSLNQIRIKFENGGEFTNADLDDFILGLYDLGNITNEKVDEKLKAGLITQEEAEKMYR